MLLADILPFALSAGATMLVTYYATRGIGNLWLLLGARIAMAAVVYVAVMKLAHAKILDEALGFLWKKTG